MRVACMMSTLLKSEFNSVVYVHGISTRQAGRPVCVLLSLSRVSGPEGGRHWFVMQIASCDPQSTVMHSAVKVSVAVLR